MIRDQQLVCDSCQQVISRITFTPAPEWATMHNLCSACFVELKKQSVSRN
jgi:hypothetical protein